MDGQIPAADTIPVDINPQGFETIPDVLACAVAQYPDNPAFTSFGRTLCYAELGQLAQAFALYLQRETDLKPGDRIAIQLPNLIQYPVVLYGAMLAGLVVVNTNPLYTASEMQHQFNDSGARALIIHKSMAHKADQILASTAIDYTFVTQVGDLHDFVKRTLLNAAVKYLKRMEPKYHLPGAIPLRSALLKYMGGKPDPVTRVRGDIAVLQYTGGTTGVSKGAMLTHANLISNMLQGQKRIDESGSGWQRQLILPLPLYHIYAFTIAQASLISGGHIVLIPNPRDLDGFVKELSNWQPSTFIGLNTLFVALCNHERFRALDFSALQVTFSGGMALTHAAADQWHQVTGCQVVEGYGLTETAPAVCMNRVGALQIGSIGFPVIHTDVRILQEGVEQPVEQPGELCVKGPQVMRGYWQREEDTRESFTADGYFRTGDIAVRQADGYIRIVDRAKDMIIVSGFNVYPNEVEDVVSLHPDVLECAAVGIPDHNSGEAVKLFVVAKATELNRELLRDWCKERLTRYKVPKHVEFVAELPKSNVGKILRRALRTPAAEPQPAEKQLEEVS
ncbi:AMP-binding protein [Marinobacterium jannaschii]|uniref:AMP-binding protein n=1 Tax=Marinobacterium jannaschii TaxID=64970 RepID=UPI0005669257|nr:AMP-binding protein [Marinobacterium jannaschii]